MGKKRKSKPMRPWCWYCEKDFEDDKVLVTHQRAKHFKCERCNKKLTTAGGMVVHCQQVHNIGIYKVPNALPGRDSLEVEIFGMEGIPEQDMIAHEIRLAGNNQNNSSNKKSKTSGSGQYGELTLEQIQEQMEARKTQEQQQYYGYGNYPYYNGFPPPPQQPQPQNFEYVGGYIEQQEQPWQGYYMPTEIAPVPNIANDIAPIVPPQPPKTEYNTSPVVVSQKNTSTLSIPLKKKATKTLLIYNNQDLSPEEQRAKLEKHKYF